MFVDRRRSVYSRPGVTIQSEKKKRGVDSVRELGDEVHQVCRIFVVLVVFKSPPWRHANHD